MTATLLNHRVDLQQQVATVDAVGQPSTSWESVAFLWANVRFSTGLSAIKSGADTSISKASVRVRHGAFNAGQRLIYGTQVLDIQAVLPDGQKKYIDLVCEVVNADV